MVGLDDDDVGLADAVADALRRVAEVGDPREGPAGREEVALEPAREAEPHRVLRVVGDGEALDLEIAVHETRMPVAKIFQSGLQVSAFWTARAVAEFA